MNLIQSKIGHIGQSPTLACSYLRLNYAGLPKTEQKEILAWGQMGDELPQKDKGRFIKEWIDNCENIIKKNKKAQQELRKKGRSALWDAAYDEKIINQIAWVGMDLKAMINIDDLYI